MTTRIFKLVARSEVARSVLTQSVSDPHIRLAHAVFEMGMRDLALADTVKPRRVNPGSSGKSPDWPPSWARDAADWLLDDDRTNPFSFLRLCELFHLDPAMVRLELFNAYPWAVDCAERRRDGTVGHDATQRPASAADDRPARNGDRRPRANPVPAR